MDVIEEVRNHSHVAAHWTQLGQDETCRRRLLTQQAQSLADALVKRLLTIHRFDKNEAERIQRIACKASKRYERRAAAYYGF